MTAGHKAMGNQWKNEETAPSPSVALCHAEEPEGIWLGLGFLKQEYSLTSPFGGLTTSKCSMPHWSTVLNY